MTKIKCPGCPLELDEADYASQRNHMLDQHPDIVEERLRESRRWDGWVND